SATPASGTLSAGDLATISVALPDYDTAGARTETCTVSTANGSGGPLSFGISVDVQPDITAPVVSMAGLNTLTGAVTLTATATDGAGVTEVDYALDGATIASTSGAPWTATWTSQVVLNGPHTLSATAFDAAGNQATFTEPVWVVNSTNGAALSVHTTLGLLDHATAEVANSDHYLLNKSQYVVSYDGSLRVPNWSSWELNAAWMGAAARQNDFRPDPAIPAAIPQAQLSDYAGSGYDRGHLCPSDDRDGTVADNQSTFFLSNMVPQLHAVNAGPWLQLETYERTLAAGGKELFIVAGGIYDAGAPKSIGADKVAVPSATFKVIVVLDSKGQAPSAATRVIAAIVPNDASITQTTDWKQFRVRPHDIELRTGLTLMPDVPQEVRDVLMGELDAG
ncbi:MAG: DNA/RNA non-specific endonuclease, partial [Deltaproteobacteria bacterium]|nr:DNA/RNA non-specific endonuclease [Deltaproteobacteria bacterium]